jgi:hypothetical protein
MIFFSELTAQWWNFRNIIDKRQELEKKNKYRNNIISSKNNLAKYAWKWSKTHRLTWSSSLTEQDLKTESLNNSKQRFQPIFHTEMLDVKLEKKKKKRFSFSVSFLRLLRFLQSVVFHFTVYARMERLFFWLCDRLKFILSIFFVTLDRGWEIIKVLCLWNEFFFQVLFNKQEKINYRHIKEYFINNCYNKKRVESTFGRNYIQYLIMFLVLAVNMKSKKCFKIFLINDLVRVIQ